MTPSMTRLIDHLTSPGRCSPAIDNQAPAPFISQGLPMSAAPALDISGISLHNSQCSSIGREVFDTSMAVK